MSWPWWVGSLREGFVGRGLVVEHAGEDLAGIRHERR